MISSSKKQITERPLTQSQLLIWTGQQLDPDSPLYNMAFLFEIEGALDPSQFALAFARLVAESDAMRSVMLEESGVPRQMINQEVPAPLAYLDWSRKPGVTDLENWATKRTQERFDLTECLFDAVLIKISETNFVWYLNQHHLITDAWSVTVQFARMAELYQDESKDLQLPQFADYLPIENQGRQATKPHWVERSKSSTLPKLYGHKDGSTTSASTRVSTLLGRLRTKNLKALCSEPDIRAWNQDLALFQVITTVLFGLIHRVSGDNQLSIGSLSHNRTTAELKRTVGLFIELYPLQVKIDHGETWGSLFQKVRNESMLYLKNAAPGQTSAMLSSGFNVVLNFIHADFGTFCNLPTESTWIHSGHTDPRHAIRLHVMDFNQEGEMQLQFDLNDQVFSETARQQVPQHFLSLLDAFIEDRSIAIAEPEICTEKELKLLQHLNDTDEDIPFASIDQLVFSADRESSTAALSIAGKTISYGQLEEEVKALASRLLESGLTAGDRVGLHLSRSPEFVTAALACMRTSIAFVPISAASPAGRIKLIMVDADLKLLLSEEKLIVASQIKDAPCPVWVKEKWSSKPFTKGVDSREITKSGIAYLLYTSGSTGNPKGVLISNEALANYLHWCQTTYRPEDRCQMPFCTSVGFDLTITSLFLPLIIGGTLHIYPEPDLGPDLAIIDVVKDNGVNVIKLTPSHLHLVRDQLPAASNLRVMIVGGEDFKATLAQTIQHQLPELTIYNEYGPTEATVGCIVQKYSLTLTEGSVPIGIPIPNMKAYILDSHGKKVPVGVVGELFLAGTGLAAGYWADEELTKTKFAHLPNNPLEKLYRTGDLVRFDGERLHYLGRQDNQVKIGGRRIELGEVESMLAAIPEVDESVVVLHTAHKQQPVIDHNCTKCGLPSNYPTATFDDHGVCNLCRSFENYQEQVKPYFRTHQDLKEIVQQSRKEGQSYDCIMLLSGGKDSTYALAQLVDLGFKVLAFTLDNGYISEGAKANIKRVCNELGVDQVLGETPAMNAIFVDSLERYSNVCNGCFKTIYTLSLKLAVDKNIPFIVTGLSRGQFFETRLTEELFLADSLDVADIDRTILEARKQYHRVDDAVNQMLDSDFLQSDEVFEKVRFLDYYRYSDVSLAEMMHYLDQKLPWVRPSDTGRSTNCLINQLGIYVHKKEQGYSNYAFPYSWDVRMGHKTRNASLEEINEEIDEDSVKRMMGEIGFRGASDQAQLVAFYTASAELSREDLQNHLRKRLPDFMVPTLFRQLPEMPMTENGKIDRANLPGLQDHTFVEQAYVAPSNEIEELVAKIWSEVMQQQQIGVDYDFLALGGTSLAAIRIVSRLNQALEMNLPVSFVFEEPSVRQMSASLEKIMLEILEAE